MHNFGIRNFTKYRVQKKKLTHIFKQFLLFESITINTEMSLVLVGDRRIQTINHKYRQQNKITDVISFEGDFQENTINDFCYLGEIFICIPQAQRQAKKKNININQEVIILFTHGMFHLLGYDHLTDKDYLIMSQKEKAFLTFIQSNDQD